MIRNRHDARRAWPLLPALLLLGGLSVGSAPADAAPAVGDSSWNDFNDDGYDDLAIGVPYDDVGGVAGAGVVHVLYGSADGLRATGSQLWHQNVSGIDNSAEGADHFGWSLAAGNFNHDTYGDLAIGAPHEDLTVSGAAAADAGIVHVLWGSGQGLTATNSVTRNLTALSPAAGAEFGFAMVAFDVHDLDSTQNGADGFADLAVGAPGFNNDAGRIRVFDGQQLSPASDGGSTTDIAFLGDDRIGSVLGAGDLAGAAYDDLIIGCPLCDGGGTDSGQVMVRHDQLSGGSNFRQALNGVSETPEAGDRFGAAVAAADVDFDGFDELFIGAPGEDISSRIDAGVVHVRWSDPDGNGAQTVLWQHFTQAQPGGSNDSNGPGDMFGSALTSGEFDPAFPDRDFLAIGAPGDRVDPDAAAGSGAVMVMTGNRSMMSGRNYRQGVGLISQQAEGGDAFGQVLAAGNYGLGDADDLVVGVPKEDRAGLTNTGIVQVIYGADDWYALGAIEQVWHQDSSGIAETGQAKDRFGLGLP